MEMTEIPKLDLTASSSSSSCEVCESEPKMSTQKISVSDHINGFQYLAEKSDNFVIDMDSFSHSINKDSSNAHSRITRTLSRKGSGSQRWGDKKINVKTTLNDHRDILVATSSPKAAVVGSSMLDQKPVAVVVGTTDHTNSPHQITISSGTGSIGSSTTTPTTENKYFVRRNSFRRGSWGLDPKRVLLFFATLSSMGTILLIYLTLSLNKHYANEYRGAWQQ
ncbi:putative Transmembrane protein [Quillaja saponaria]|uniref:Transmembrane protein n=1 Tax=Quillaja saponaria TaxID=32244 RepID=A0AAD7KV77_QUISA|nr:putative Transmembrane protein [Quillaja saponaria]